MSAVRYAGLTWDHPRGYAALQAAAKEVAPGHGIHIDWDIQPLEGFESAPIDEICSRYDLVVLDHPHIGEAVAAHCLTPLEDVFDASTLVAFAMDSIGPTFESYRFGGKAWALPLDAATQVCAYRPDLVEGPPPSTWEDVLALSRTGTMALSLAGPHAILSFLSICVALGEPPATDDAALLIGDPVGRLAFKYLSTLAEQSAPSVRDLNPIGILEHMADHDDVAVCPLIYGYVNYARGDSGRKPLRFSNAPRLRADGRPGTVLGGTGIGITRRCSVTPQLVEHLRWLMGAQAQEGFIPIHQGQPSRRHAWANTEVNAAWGGFYSETRDTLEAAYVRPRHDGYIAWQTGAAAYIRTAIHDKTDAATVVRHLNETFKASIHG